MPNKQQIKQKLEKEKNYRLQRNEELLKEQEKINRALKVNSAKLRQVLTILPGI